MSLREQKKAQTRQLIADIAMGLFSERGFEVVTVAEIARASNVSVNTVFNYFPTKEDLFFDRQAAVEDLLASVVRTREPGESALRALRRHQLGGLATEHWTGGFWEGAIDFYRMVDSSPSLRARERELGERITARLAETLAAESGAAADDPTPTVVAGLVTGARHAILGEARRRISAREPFATVKEWVIAAVSRSFDVLEQAIPDYCVRPESPASG